MAQDPISELEWVLQQRAGMSTGIDPKTGIPTTGQVQEIRANSPNMPQLLQQAQQLGGIQQLPPGVQDVAQQQMAEAAAQAADVKARYDMAAFFHPQPTAAPVSTMSEFGLGLERGKKQTLGMLHGAAGVIGDLVGADEFARARYDRMVELMNEAQQYQGSVQGFEDALTSPGKFVSWAAGVLGEQMPVIASTLVTGGVGGVTGALLQRGLLSTAGKVALEKAGASWALRGATAGLYVGATALETGGIAAEQREAGFEVQPGVALAGGAAAGALEVVSPLVVARMLNIKLPFAAGLSQKIEQGLAERGLAGRMGMGAAMVSGSEAATEAGQEVIAIAARKYVDENYDALGPEAAARIIDSAAAGALMGALFGGIGGVPRHAAPQPSGEGVGGQPTVAGTPPPALPAPQGPVALLPPPPAQLTYQPEGGQQQLGGEIKVNEGGTPEGIILFGPNGAEEFNPDTATEAEVQRIEALVPPENRTPAQQMLMKQVEGERLQHFRDTFVRPDQTQPSERLSRLINVRNRLSEDRRNYVDEERLSPAAEKKVAQLSAEVNQLAKEEGVVLPKYDNLSEWENNKLAFLMEKDRTEGLNQKEIDQLERLSAKSQGEQAVSRRKMSDAELEAFEKEVEENLKGEGPLYSDRGTKAKGITDAEFREAIAKVRINPLNEPTIHVVERASDIPDATFGRLLSRKKHVEAMVSRRQGGQREVFFVLENLTKDRAPLVYLHEIVAHHGLRAGLPNAVFQDILKLIKKTQMPWIQEYLKARGLKFDPKNVAIAAEEYIAKLAETNPRAGLLQRIVSIIKQWLRELGFNVGPITDQEIIAILSRVRKRLEGPVIPNSRPLTAHPELLMSANGKIPSYTIRLVERLKKEDREWVTRKYVNQLIKDLKLSKEETDAVQEVLALPEFGERFRTDTFQEYLADRAMPLNWKISHAWLDYGYDQIGRDRGIGNPFVHEFEHPNYVNRAATNHFNNPSYIAHSRGFDSYEGETGGGYTRSIIEIQSDLMQHQLREKTNDKGLTPEQLYNRFVDLTKEYNAFYAASKEIKELSKKLHNFSVTKEAVSQRVLAILRAELLPIAPVTAELVKAENMAFVGHEDALQLLSSIVVSLDLTKTEARINAAKLQRELEDLEGRSAQPKSEELLRTEAVIERSFSTLFQRIIREEMKAYAQHLGGMMNVLGKNGDKLKMRLIDTNGMAQAEGWLHGLSREMLNMHLGNGRLSATTNAAGGRTFWLPPGADVIDMIPNRKKIIAIRHNELVKWAKRTFNAKNVTDENGIGWVEWEIDPKLAYEPVMVLASDSANSAIKMEEALGQRSSLPQDLDKYNSLWKIKLSSIFLSPLQFAQQYGLEPIKRYINWVDRWAHTRMEIMEPADKTVQNWLKLGKTESNKLANALFEATAQSDELERALTAEEEVAILKKFNVTGETLEVYKEVRQRLVDLLDRLEPGLKYDAARKSLNSEEEAKKFLERWEATRNDEKGRAQLLSEVLAYTGKNEAELFRLTSRLGKIEKEIDQMRNRNYFPYMRFGQWSVTAIASKDGTVFEGKQYKAGDQVGFWLFENKKEQEAFRDSPEMAKLGQSAKIRLSKMEDQHFSFVGLPKSFIDALEDTLELNEKQRLDLKEIVIKHSPGRAFLRHLIRRKGVEGFSQDAMRVFATYMMNAANNLARVETHTDMDIALTDLRDMKTSFEETQGDSRGLMMIYNSLKDHNYYLLNPKNDLAKYRSMAFMFYLGFNVKSALVNLTQTPMVTYPYLAARYGDARSIAELARAMKDTTRIYKEGRVPFDPLLDKLVARAIKEGLIDESQATELAGISEGTALARVLPQEKAHRLVNNTAYYSAFLFRHAEKFSRFTAFIAAARLEMAKGSNEDAIYAAAKETVRSTLFEYAKWNRPKFMRGPASIFFLFWTFMQNMAYIAFGGQGAQTAIRVWLMLLMIAGIQGLPFAENILDILNFGTDKVKRALGMKDPYTELRNDIRELLLKVTDNPDMFMHGLSRYWGLGPLHIMELMGIPMPHVDTSGSTSLGRMIPGIGELLGHDRNPEEKFARTIIEMLGPVAAVPYNVWRAAEDNNPDSWKRWERALPSALKAASKAGRYMTRGAEEFRGGGKVAAFEQHNTEHTAEILAQSFGFTPSRITQRYELRAAQEMIKEYYVVKRSMLLSDLAYAMDRRDREAVADMRQEIRDFNRGAPSPLRITQETIKKSMEQRKKKSEARERGVPTEKMLRGQYREVGRLYPETEFPGR